MDAALVALCADAESLRNPGALGLPEENLAAQEWLRLFSSGEDARRFLRSDRTVDEVWIASSEDVDPINLAATLKRDRRDRCVCLLAFEGTGSLKSRAMQAGVDATLTRQAFLERYAQRKRRGACAGDGRFDYGRPAARGALAEDRRPPASAAHPEGLRTPERDPWREGGASRVGSAEAFPPPRAASCASPRPQEDGGRRPSTQSAREAFLLPVVSGSGGAGKSAVAALAAVFAQGLGYRTLLVDFDLRFGDCAPLLGAKDALRVDQLVAAPERIERLKPEGFLPAVLAAPERLEEAEALEPRTGEVLDQVGRAFDVVVANTATSWSEQHATLLERSSKALFLVDQRSSSLLACRRALDACARCGIPTGPVQVVANRCSKHAPYTSIDVSCALGGAPAVELQDGGRDVEELLAAGLPFELVQARNPLCTSLEHLMVDVLPGCDGSRADLTADEGLRGVGRMLRKAKRSRRRKDAPCPC